MSYNCGSPYANLFSNPNVVYHGRPTGSEFENNVQTIEDNKVRESTKQTHVSQIVIYLWIACHLYYDVL